MKRRDVLKTFVAMSLPPNALAASSPDGELPAIIVIDAPVIYEVFDHLDRIPPGISRMGIISTGVGESEINHFQEHFHTLRLVDEMSLLAYEHPAPFEVFAPAQWQALVPMLPREKKWLIIGALRAGMGATLLPLLTRYAVENGGQAHVFGIGPFSFEPEFIASSTQKVLTQYASDAVFVWYRDICLRLNPDQDVDDVFKVMGEECHAWIMKHCAMAPAHV